MSESGKETGFTPGPWTFDWSVSMHDRSDLPCVIDADRLVIAQCWDDGHSEEECVANARLIAAAPKLYELLARASEEMRLIEMKDCGAIYDVGLRSEIRSALLLSNTGGTGNG